MASEAKRDPLLESTGDNIKPRSKLPTPGKSRIAVPSSLRRPAATAAKETKMGEVTVASKRKAESDNQPPVKKARLNLSSSSDPGSGTSYGVTRPVRKPSGCTSNVASIKPQGKRPAVPKAKPPVAKVPAAAASAPAEKKASSKKRPAWDLKGRLQDMEEVMTKQSRRNGELQAQIQQTNECVSNLQSDRNNLEGTVTVKNQVVENLERQIRESQRDLEEKDEKTRSLNRKVSDMEFSYSTLERQRNTLEGELSTSQQEATALKTSVATMAAAQSGMSAELSATKSHLEDLLKKYASQQEEFKALRENHDRTVEEFNQTIRGHETERRKLHNMVQELKGNIRVFCRVRPLLGDELEGNNGEINHIAFPDETSDKKTIVIDKVQDANPNESCAGGRKGSNNTHDFSFDKVFSPNTNQAEVFEEISQLVQSALDGYHVCIFAYGQTGSGKTYTMEGPMEADDTTVGMIPRAVEQVFTSTESLVDKGWKYNFVVSFMEIYNQTIRDLLGSGKEDVKHEIKMVSANSSDVTVTNLTSVEVTEPNKVYQLLRKAGNNRAVAETKCNARSSRSHSIFQMKITGKNAVTGENCTGLLNLIDLAGSERLKDSGSEGQRLKETQAINSSLANLGNVIVALANKEVHIPYRNSKLTYVLQHCLGGKSKVLMFANVSPKAECYSETINSLRFATKVNNCNIGTATQQKK